MTATSGWFTPEASAELGARIVARRVALGWSGETLGRMAGITRAAVGYIEGGMNRPSLPVALAIAEALGCSLYDLIPSDVMAALREDIAAHKRIARPRHPSGRQSLAAANAELRKRLADLAVRA